jgi:exopolysaccharide biosynthesis polyprenyl glycosylphosphotransferase
VPARWTPSTNGPVTEGSGRTGSGENGSGVNGSGVNGSGVDGSGLSRAGLARSATQGSVPGIPVPSVPIDPIDVGELRGPEGTTLTITEVESLPSGTTPRGRRLPVTVTGAGLVVLDAIAVCAGWVASPLAPGATSAQPCAGLTGIAVALPLWCGLVAAGGGYELEPFVRPPIRAAADAGLRFAAIVSLLVLALRPDAAAGLVVALPVALAAILALRTAARLAAAGRSRPARVLVVGGAAPVERAVRRLGQGSGVRVVGRCVTGELRAAAEGDVLRRRLTATARAAGADVVLLADTGAFPAPSLRRLAWTLHASGVGLLVGAGPSGVAAHRLRVRAVADLPVVHVEPPVFTGARRIAKSAFDRGAALALLLLLAPLLLAIAVAVRISGPGPVIFRQQRVGRHGERFVMLKFRSMCADAPLRRDRLEGLNDHATGVLFKMRSDPRITGVGRVLRRLSLDELPQLVNVLRGDMSLVGPRPALPSEVERYEPDVLRRLLVKPGLTGLWQVSGRSDLDWHESVRLDLGYVENWSFAVDLNILRRTVRAVLGGVGAR